MSKTTSQGTMEKSIMKQATVQLLLYKNKNTLVKFNQVEILLCQIYVNKTQSCKQETIIFIMGKQNIAIWHKMSHSKTSQLCKDFNIHNQLKDNHIS